MVQIGPVEVKQERGRPIQAYGRTLTPVALVIRAVKRRGVVGTRGVAGSGWGAAMAVPRMVIEERDGEQRALPIHDETASVLLQMALVAVVAPILAALVVFLNRLMRRKGL